jgi:hypothetical protein
MAGLCDAVPVEPPNESARCENRHVDEPDRARSSLRVVSAGLLGQCVDANHAEDLSARCSRRGIASSPTTTHRLPEATRPQLLPSDLRFLADAMRTIGGWDCLAAAANDLPSRSADWPLFFRDVVHGGPTYLRDVLWRAVPRARMKTRSSSAGKRRVSLDDS